MKDSKVYAYGYIRVSSLMQEDGKAVSLTMQAEEITKWCEFNKYKLICIEKDSAVSGTLKAKDRPLLYNLLTKLRKGDVFITYTVARFSRNFTDLMVTVDEIHERGAVFHSLKEGFNTSTISGQLNMNILGSVATMQAQEISRYATETAEYFRQTGRHSGGIPYGYKKRSEAKGSGLVAIPEQHVVINYIKQRRAHLTDGRETPYLHIANELNELEVKTPGKSKKWHPSMVKTICERDYDKIRTKGRAEFEILYANQDESK